jgi:uncharacterized protein
MKWLRGKINQLFQLKDTEHAVSLGMAIGIFFGFTPLLGLKTLLSMGASRLFRANVIAGVIGVTLHDILLPFAPIIMKFQYDLGVWLLSHPHHFPDKVKYKELKLTELLNWATFSKIGLPMTVGAIPVALPFGLITYFVTLRLVKRVRQRRDARAEAKLHAESLAIRMSQESSH